MSATSPAPGAASTRADAVPEPDPAGGARAGGRPRLAALAVASGLAVAGGYYGQALLPALASGFGASRGATTLVVVAAQLGYCLGLIALLPVSDLTDRRLLASRLLAMEAVLLAGMAAAPCLPLLVLFAGGVGATAVAAQVLVAVVAAGTEPAHRGRAVAVVMTGLTAGILAARTFAGAVAQLAGWRMVYAAAAALLLLALWPLRRALFGPVPAGAGPGPEWLTERQERVTARSAAAALVAPARLLAAEPLLRRRAGYGFASFAAFTAFWTSAGYLLTSPPYRFGDAAVGLLGLAGVAGVLLAAPAGRLADAGHARTATGAFLAVLVGGFGLVALGRDHLTALIAGAVVVDIGVRGVQTTNQQQIYLMRGAAHGQITAAYMSCYFAGGVAGASASAVAYGLGGWPAVCLAGGGVGLAALLFWLAAEARPAPTAHVNGRTLMTQLDIAAPTHAPVPEPVATPTPVDAPAAASLAKFVDPLPIPVRLTPCQVDEDGVAQVTVRMRPVRMRLHSQLPPTTLWGYQGSVPGPVFDVRRGQRLRVVWRNELTGPLPVADVHVPQVGTAPPPLAENTPGRSGGQDNKLTEAVPPWTVVHLHGSKTAGGNDGWTENAVSPGSSQVSEYENDQAAMTLWYHDHAMDITRLNVMSGLAGMYLLRDEEEDALGLPAGDREIPMLICDRNLDTDAAGAFTGQLLHKTVGTRPFFGPYTLVNGAIWPHWAARPAWYRLRLLNGSNARFYRLVLLDAQGQPVTAGVHQIGSDSGLLPAPVELGADGLLLAPAERADVLLDLRAFPGQTLRLVNTAPAPFTATPTGLAPGVPDPAHLLAEPDVLQIRVADEPVVDPFTLPATLSPSFTRYSDATLPPNATRRLLVLAAAKDDLTNFQLWEMAAADPAKPPAPGDGVVQIVGADGVTTTWTRVASDFNDTVNWRVAQEDWEQWSILNLTGATHPIHLHLVRFQAVRRETYDTSGFVAATGGTVRPVRRSGDGPGLDPNEQGWKDVIRVGPSQRVDLIARFTGASGRYMYHCHILEHEDAGMMRPFVVMPAAVMAVDPDMAGMQM